MTWPRVLIGLLTWVGAFVVNLYTDRHLLGYSFTGLYDLALVATTLVWPLLVGVGAAVMVYELGPRSRDSLLLSLPLAGRVRACLRALAPVWWGALAGGGICVAIAAAIALPQEYYPPVRTFLTLVPAAAGSLAAIACGALVGALTRSWVAPPIIALIVYGVIFSSYTVREGVLKQLSISPAFHLGWVPSASTTLAATGAHLLLIAAAASGLWWVSARSRVAAGCALALAAGWVAWLPHVADLDPLQASPRSSWACQSLPNSGNSLCVAGELRPSLTGLGRELAPVDARLHALDPTLTLTYGPIPGEGVIALESPGAQKGDVLAEVCADAVASAVCDEAGSSPACDTSRMSAYLRAAQTTVFDEPAYSEAEASDILARVRPRLAGEAP
ncbi:hypothetical protein H8R18_06250 [Nanchangia anserum]|uniref:Uncharacterized protein n=1 Tax=Nanchangia anserum TaxID=2692125 RepID=A0A8I0KPQ1_9ACTO|nr:hypothetical protein [Nanchangia anserum]MBD3689135.1 hypothetical protein [Nanchangia anserum]QOX81369.1 hypothetical protein H8R18_06250 [Nanchangia anserum]